MPWSLSFAWLHFASSERVHWLEALEFPRHCSGVLELQGTYTVSEPLNFTSCTLRGQPGTLIELAAPLRFAALRLEGHINITATESFNQTCVTADNISVATEAASISRCHSAKEAGCILADHVDLEGALALRQCTAVEGGGGIAAKTVVHHQGTVSFSDCRASNGGGLHSCNFTQKGGTMTFQNCSQHRRKVKLAFLSALLGKSHGGGGLSVKNVLTQEGGLLNFSRCTSATNGGGLYMRQGHQIGGTMRFNWCQHQEHANHGGALFVDENVNLSGAVVIKSSWAAGKGGGIYVGGAYNSTGSVFIRNASSIKYGGGMYVGKGLEQRGGVLKVVRGRSYDKGGGIFIEKGGMRLHHTSFSMDSCSSGRSGGGIFTHHGGVSVVGNLTIANCSCLRDGGGLSVSDEGLNVTGQATFRNCSSSSRSAALSVAPFLNVSGLSVMNSHDPICSPVSVAGPMHVENLLLAYTEDRIPSVAGRAMKIRRANCSDARQCEFVAASMQIEELRCAQGAGRFYESGALACYFCEGQTFQPEEAALNPECQPCPAGTKRCSAESIKMKPGNMVVQPNISRRLFCPNERACPGGTFPDATVPMCATGYTGIGCVQCAPGFGIENGVALSCSRCPTKVSQVAFQMTFIVLKAVGLFGLAIQGVLKATTEIKRSTVLLNQLMSFATVASTSMAAVMHTGTFQKLSGALQRVLLGVDFVSDTAQGADSGGLSTACIAEFLGLPSELWMTHVLHSVTPALLILALSFRDPWLALVVGANCFMPEFCSFFGRYLVCYRVQSEERGGKLHCDFLPDIPAPVTTIAGIIALLLLGVVIAWTRAASSTVSPTPPHVMYLTNAYKAEFAAWEVERLTRKMLLTLAAAMLPVTLAPALQLACLSVILTISLLCFLIFMPYKELVFNLVEAVLLATGLIMTALSSTVLVSDTDWSISEWTECALLISIGTLATSIIGVMVVLYAVAMVRERGSKTDKSP
ncbi:unnamed protein product [Effrenium voratum]|nr:unnamed protein product [Effrenium voratum]